MRSTSEHANRLRPAIQTASGAIGNVLALMVDDRSWTVKEPSW